MAIIDLDPDSPEGQALEAQLKKRIDNVMEYKKKHGLKSVEGLVMGDVPTSMNVGAD